MGFLRSIWSWLKWVVAFLLVASPWLYGRVGSYSVYQDEWVEYAGGVLLAVYLVATAAHSFLSARVRDARALDWPFVFLMGAPLILGLVLLIFGKPIYANARFAMERPALEAFVREGGACPQRQCLSEGPLKAVVWSANNRTWFGICHDPEQQMSEAFRARREERAAGRPAQPRVLEAVATRASRVSGDWYVCAASKAPLGVPLVD